ncbi:MAG: SAM-dependent methyltransferase [Clostridia bacterium]|nr:SAM-dependent methyltransferase [Clostridia bacterium]
MKNNNLSLSPRLYSAAHIAEKADRIIDVGCDHGYLSAYMLLNGLASFAFLSDLRHGPLKKARETVADFGVEDRTETVLSDGLDNFTPSDADTVFICGMGGELICDIISKAPWLCDGFHTLVLQPMTKDEELRKLLYGSGYTVTCERAVYDSGRLYVVMRAGKGDGNDLYKNRFIFSDSFKTDPLFNDYLRKKQGIIRKIAEGKRIAGLDVSDEDEALRFLEKCYVC